MFYILHEIVYLFNIEKTQFGFLISKACLLASKCLCLSPWRIVNVQKYENQTPLVTNKNTKSQPNKTFNKLYKTFTV